MYGEYPMFAIPEDKKVAVPFVAYEKYTDKDGDHKDDAKLVAEFLKIKAVAAKPPCNSKHTGLIDLAGEDHEIEYDEVATEAGKKIARGILKGIWKNEKTGMCFEDFDMINIFISREGKVKFRGVKRCVAKSKVEHQIKTRENYLKGHSIIRDMFLKAGKDKKIPVDIDHLLNHILNEPAKAQMYHIHVSLLPAATVWSAFVKMYDHVTHTLAGPIRERILLRLPYHAGNWSSLLAYNRLLMKVYNFKGGNIYILTEAKVAAKYNKKHLNKWSSLTNEEKARQMKIARAQKFLDFLRNRKSHRMEHFTPTEKYKAEGSDMVAHVRYPLLMAHLQEELFNEQVMAELLLEQFF